LRWLFVGLTVVLLPIGLVVGEVVLALTYYGVLLPIGLIFRLLARDRLQLKCDRAADSYWRPKPKPRDLGSYLRQS
jgi:hypothetical protein